MTRSNDKARSKQPIPTGEVAAAPDLKDQAAAIVRPQRRHVVTADLFTKGGELSDVASIARQEHVFEADVAAARAGDMGFVSDILTSQAMTLDYIFTDLLYRSGANRADYPQAAERYLRLALKAQANSRATIEALARLHQPREQTVRHVHVADGGQAVIADEFHHHSAGGNNEKSAEQSHAAGTPAAGASPALPGPNALGNALPCPSREGEAAVPIARRDESRGAKGKSQRLETRLSIRRDASSDSDVEGGAGGADRLNGEVIETSALETYGYRRIG